MEPTDSSLIVSHSPMQPPLFTYPSSPAQCSPTKSKKSLEQQKLFL